MCGTDTHEHIKENTSFKKKQHYKGCRVVWYIRHSYRNAGDSSSGRAMPFINTSNSLTEGAEPSSPAQNLGSMGTDREKPPSRVYSSLQKDHHTYIPVKQEAPGLLAPERPGNQ